MQLRKPKLEDKMNLLNYVLEHYINGEMNICAANEMPIIPYEEWIKKIKADEKGKNKEWGISEIYVLEDNNEILGMLNIRYTLSEEKAEKYGHIGYGVRPKARKKGYATYMLKEALKKCKKRGMTEVIITCYEKNIASQKIILNNNGEFYKKDKIKGKDSVFYKINLK